MILSSIFDLKSMLKHIETLSFVDFTFGSVPSWGVFFLVWLVWLVFPGIQKRKCQASMIRSQQRRGCKGKQHKSRRKMEQKQEQFLQLCRWNGLLSLRAIAPSATKISQNQNQKQGVEGIDERYFFCFWFFVLFGLSQLAMCRHELWVCVFKAGREAEGPAQGDQRSVPDSMTCNGVMFPTQERSPRASQGHMHRSHIHMPILSVVCNGFKRTEWLRGSKPKWDFFGKSRPIRFKLRLAAYRPIQVPHKGVTTQWCSHLHQFRHMTLWPCREMSYFSWDVLKRVECCSLGFESFVCFDSTAFFCSLWYSICFYFFWTDCANPH